MSNSGKKKLSKSKLLTLLEIYYGRLQDVNAQFTTLFTIFLSSIFVVFGASVIGIVSKLDIWTELLVVSSGLSMAVALAVGLRKMSKYSYKLILQTIIKINITEEQLGLGNKEIYSSEYLDKSSLILDRHISSMEKYKTVDSFVDQNEKKDQMGSVYYITSIIFVFSGILFFVEIGRCLAFVLQ